MISHFGACCTLKYGVQIIRTGKDYSTPIQTGRRREPGPVFAMALFIGTHVNKIDRKGRVSLPADYRAELPEDEEVTAADRLIIDSPTTTGLIVLKALAAEPGLMPQAQASLAAAKCGLQTDTPQAKR